MRVVDTAAAQRWLAACPGPKAVRDLPEASHVIPLCAEWEALTDEMAAFILAHRVARFNVVEAGT
jgi:hypothetical protein